MPLRPLLLLAAVAVLALTISMLRTGSDRTGSSTRPRSEPAALAGEEIAERGFDLDHPGYVTYQTLGCNVCHGRDLRGTRMGPDLAEAWRHYTRDRFAAYLANPDSMIATDERLREIDERYRMFVMPSFELERAQVEELAGLILGRPR